MNQLTYHVGMGADGKPLVTVSSENPEAAAQAIPWVKQTYARMATANAAVTREPEQLTVAAATDQEPRCQVHNVPMASVNGRHGAFYSCHTKNPDGSWCSYRPPK